MSNQPAANFISSCIVKKKNTPDQLDHSALFRCTSTNACTPTESSQIRGGLVQHLEQTVTIYVGFEMLFPRRNHRGENWINNKLCVQ